MRPVAGGGAGRICTVTAQVRQDDPMGGGAGSGRGSGRARWDVLFDDLEAQLSAADQREDVIDRAEHTRAIRGEVLLAERLVTAAGRLVRVRIHGHGDIEGAVTSIGKGWLTLRGVDRDDPIGGSVTGGPRRWAATRSWLVPLSSVLSVRGLDQRSDPGLGLSRRRLDIRSALRAISRDRVAVRVCLLDGSRLTGTIDRVGRDHLDLGEHPEDLARRATAVRQTVVIATTALSCVISSAEPVR